MSVIHTLYGHFLSMIRSGQEVMEPLSGVTRAGEYPLRLGEPQTVSSVCVGRTIPTSASYEFARVQIQVSVTGDMSQREVHDAWVRRVVLELILREEESVYRVGRKPVPLSAPPGTISFGEMRIGYGRTICDGKRAFGNNSMLRVDVEQSLFFEPSLDGFLGAYQELMERVMTQFELALDGKDSTPAPF